MSSEAPDNPLDRALKEHVKHVLQVYSAPNIFCVTLDITIDRTLIEHVKVYILAQYSSNMLVSAPDT
jgi:hypothetical protein